jgi:hypothetical protein
MKGATEVSFLALILLLLTGSDGVAGDPQEPGGLVYLSGCVDGAMALPTVSLWELPDRYRAIGRLSGTSDAHECHGAVVRVLDVVASTESSPAMFFIEVVVGGRQGWVTESVIGDDFPESLCPSHFGDDSAAIERCEAQ